MNTLNKIVKNFFSLLTGQIVSNIFSFFIVIYLARVLSPEFFGKISFAQIFVGYFLLFTDFGLQKLGIREVAKDKNRLKEISSEILSLRLFLAFFLYGILIFCTSFLNRPSFDKKLIVIFGLMIFPFSALLNWVFQGIEKMEYAGISNGLKNIITFLCLLIFVKNYQQAIYVPLLYVLGLSTSFLFLLIIYIQQFGIPHITLNFSKFKNLLKQKIPFGFSILMIQIYYNVDTLMLGFIRNDKEVGFYNTSYKLILLFNALVSLFYQTIFPIIARYWKESKEKLRLLLNTSLKLMITIAIPLGIGGTILSRKIILFFYGKEYLPYSAIAFEILIWSVVIAFVSIGFGNFLLACNLEKKYMVGVTIGAIFNTLTNFIFIPKYGLVGASITTVATEFIVLLFMLHIFQKKIFRLSLMNILKKPFLGAIIMGVTLKYFNLPFVSSLILGIIVYTIIIVLIKGITKEDFNVIRNL